MEYKKVKVNDVNKLKNESKDKRDINKNLYVNNHSGINTNTTTNYSTKKSNNDLNIQLHNKPKSTIVYDTIDSKRVNMPSNKVKTFSSRNPVLGNTPKQINVKNTKGKQYFIKFLI